MSSPRSSNYPPRPPSTSTTPHKTATSHNQPSINRSKTTPFLLHLTYRLGSYHSLSDFPVPLPSSQNHQTLSTSTHTQIPPHLQIYTWPSCTLRELAHILTTALPHLLPEPVQGTRLSFRLVFPDTRQPLGGYGGGRGGGGRGDGRLDDEMRGRYTCREMGSVVVLSGTKSQTRTDTERGGQDDSRRAPINGHDDNDDNNNDHDDDAANPVPAAAAGKSSLELSGPDLDKTLLDARFVIGDYLDVAVFPPLSDGSTAPRDYTSTSSGRGRGSFSSQRGFGFGAPPPPSGSGSGHNNGLAYYDSNPSHGRPRGDEVPYGGGRGGGGGRGDGRWSGYGGRGRERGDREGRLGGGEEQDMPRGEWRRGERLPDGSYGVRGGYRGTRGDGGAGGRGGGGYGARY